MFQTIIFSNLDLSHISLLSHRLISSNCKQRNESDWDIPWLSILHLVPTVLKVKPKTHPKTLKTLYNLMQFIPLPNCPGSKFSSHLFYSNLSLGFCLFIYSFLFLFVDFSPPNWADSCPVLFSHKWNVLSGDSQTGYQYIFFILLKYLFKVLPYVTILRKVSTPLSQCSQLLFLCWFFACEWSGIQCILHIYCVLSLNPLEYKLHEN